LVATNLMAHGFARIAQATAGRASRGRRIVLVITLGTSLVFTSLVLSILFSG
jgi:pantothenate kinase type III